MSETGNTPSGVEQKGFFSKLASGDFGLAKTYWLYTKPTPNNIQRPPAKGSLAMPS